MKDQMESENVSKTACGQELEDFDRGSVKFGCGNRTRFLIALQGSLFLASIMGAVICWNAATVKVSELETSPLYAVYLNGSVVDWADPSLPLADRRVDLQPMQISLLFAASFTGSASCVVPVTMTMRKVGTYRTQLVLGVIVVACAILSPWAAVTNFNILLVLRFLQGLAQCNPYPVIGAIVNAWAPTREQGIFVALLTGYVQLSAATTTPIASFLANNYGWPSVFYFQAGLTGILLIVWAATYRDNPEKHPMVSNKEFRKISRDKLSSKQLASLQPVPFYRIISKLPVIACCVAAFTYLLAVQVNIGFLVMYLSWAQNFSITTAGIITVIPLVLQFLLNFATGVVSDKLTAFSEHSKIRFFATLTLSGCAIGFVVSSCLPPESEYGRVGVVVMLVAFSMLGFNAGGFPKSAVLVGRDQSATVMACVQGAVTSALLSGSFIVPGLTPGRSFPEYAFLFRLYAGLLVAANVFFVVFCKAEPIDFHGDGGNKVKDSPSSQEM